MCGKLRLDDGVREMTTLKKLEKELRGHRLWLRVLSLFGSPHHLSHSLHSRQVIVTRWIGASFVVGLLVGSSVAVFEFFMSDVAVPALYQLQSPLVYLLLPAAGLGLASLTTRFLVPSREGHMTEDYILVYHGENRHMRWLNLPGKMLASIFTIASGGSMGLEGPSIYLGATAGDTIQMRMSRFFAAEDRKLLLVAGCAAGMSAIFKAPLTGVVFAMESPYKDGIAARALIPALVSSATSYITFVLLAGSEPLFVHQAQRAFSLPDLLLAVLLGLCCGLGARLFVWLSAVAHRALEPLAPWARPLAAGLLIGVLGMLVFQACGEPLNYGPGYRLIRHLLTADSPLLLLLFLFVAKSTATAFTAAGGGVGGLFFPMAAMGAIMGSAFNHFVLEPGSSLYPIIGTAAFLGAGYRTPLAAVAFVAETMGNPWALIPAMLATVASLMVVGQAGISEHQRYLDPRPGESGAFKIH
jgi:CIC family chloride channel protein